MNIGKTIVAALKVVDMERVLNDIEAEFVGFAMDVAFLETAPTSHMLFFVPFAKQLHIVPIAGIVERADTDLAPDERSVGRGHDRRLHVIPINLDGPVTDLTDDLDVMPMIVPGRPLGGLRRNLDSIGGVDDEDLIGAIVGFLGHVDVIEMGRILIAEEEAHIAMIVIFAGRLHLGFEHEVGDFDVLDQ